MCGIAVCLGADLITGRAFVDRANRILAHRGPDDSGAFAGEGVVLGHRRLAILDLTPAAHQPMRSPDGRWVLVYNGEVYNHQELRARLCKGWSFQSRSDSETVLAALALNGPRAFDDMVGMWALALWDAHQRTLLLSRDRYGQKPLYWRRLADGSLRCASEIRPLLEPDERPEMYAPAVAEYLATGNYGHLGERTFFREIRAFPAAHWARVTPADRRPSPQRYWRFPIVPKHERRPYDETARQRFRAAFEDAVASQLMSDVPVGATLSGGLDSTAVVGAMASSVPTRQIPVFTAQAPGSAFDESTYVRAVAEAWGERLQLHWIDLREMSISRMLPAVTRVQEEPFGDPSIAAHGLLMDAAREAGVPVILGGQGGDELLFGYFVMGHALLAASLREGKLRWALEEARAMGAGRETLFRIGLSALLPGLERWARRQSRLRRRDWLSPALRNAARDSGPPLAAASDLAAVWLEFVERFSLPHLVHYDDRSGMARSIEGRMPFLDHRLADIVGALDERAFLDRGRLKRLLRESCEPFLPGPVLRRRDKIGFFTPLPEMLRAQAVWVRSLITDDYARAIGVYDVRVVESSLHAVAGGNGSAEAAHRVWRALAVRVWAETFAIQSLPAVRPVA